jgi:lipopolysaccharide/colanic/teichoic acid biosynthesis glycosyltransferase
LNTVSSYYNNQSISFFANEYKIISLDNSYRFDKIQHFLDNEEASVFISLALVNGHRKINDFFKNVNSAINQNECFIGVFETYSARKNRLKINKIPLVKHLFNALDFFYNRVLPKIKHINAFYFKLNKGRNRVLSKAEVLGRLVCCGFEILSIENIDGLCYFKVKKIEGCCTKKTSSYGLIFKMKRIGKNGKLFNIYKIRTMHPYSEYLQGYMIKEFGFAENGKLANDFRLTPWGKILRRFWIDELPQLFNLLKGEMKLVGLRPVSESYFNQLPEEYKQKRNLLKPGCIPPYVSLNYNSSLEEVIASEKIYIEQKFKKKYTTDLKFFFYAIINIVLKGKRSA